MVTKDGKPIGVMVGDKAVAGYNTPSRKLETFLEDDGRLEMARVHAARILSQPHS